MRILFLSNFFPPCGNGGYEQLAQETATELVKRGHATAVLTSRSNGIIGDDTNQNLQVLRELHPEVDGGVVKTLARLLLDRHRVEEWSIQQVRKTIEAFRPDVALIWGMWNVPRSVPATVEELLPNRVVYYLCDYWPSLPSAYLQKFEAPSARALTRIPKKLLGSLVNRVLVGEDRPPLRLEHPICVSGAVRDLLIQRGVPIEHASIIPNGIKLDEFPFSDEAARRTSLPRALRLVYAGRLSPEKGIHTAIQAISQLGPKNDGNITLDLIGSGSPSYERLLSNLVASNGLTKSVAFRESVPRSQMAATLARYDALVFPSEWEEPSARIVMEAMALGLVVLGTTTGGTGEALVDGETGLTFLPGDSEALAAQIWRLLEDGDIRQDLIQAARRRVEERFTFERMVDQLERYLSSLVVKEELRLSQGSTP